jgi:hypothetical protein
MYIEMTSCDSLPPNELPISRAAVIDRDVIIVDSDVQNRRDLVDAQRRRLHGRVGRQRRLRL